MNIPGMGPQMSDPEETARRRAISRVLEAPAQGIPAAGGEEPLARIPGRPRAGGALEEAAGRGTRMPMPGAAIEDTQAPAASLAAAPAAPAGGMLSGSASGAASSQKLYGLKGFDQHKLDSGHDSPKYMVGRTLQKFDPAQGLTPEVIAALNQLGIGTFSGERDKLSVQSNDPRWNGVFQFDTGENFTRADGSTGSDAWSFQNDMPGERPFDNGGVVNPSPVTERPFDNGGVVNPAMDGTSTYQTLLARLQQLTGMSPEQQALDRVLGGR